MEHTYPAVRRETGQVRHGDMYRANSRSTGHRSAPIEWLGANIVGEPDFELETRTRAQPIDPQFPAVATEVDVPPKRPGCERDCHAANRSAVQSPRVSQAAQAPQTSGTEDLIASLAVDDRPAPCVLEFQFVSVSERRPHKSVPDE